MCQRLNLQKDCSLDHRKNVKNVLGLSVDTDALLIGVGVYGGDDDELFDQSLTITFDRSTTKITLYRLNDQFISEAESTTSTEEARNLVRKRDSSIFPPHTHTIYFPRPYPLLEKDLEYRLEHNLRPTDVLNHYSGAPFTKLGAEVWTCLGNGGNPRIEVEDFGINFNFFCIGQSQRWHNPVLSGRRPNAVLDLLDHLN